MKQSILIGLLTGLLMATIPLRAQVAPHDSDAQKESRLELGRTTPPRKTAAPALSSRRFVMVPEPVLSVPDRSIAARRSKAISDRYQLQMMAQSAVKAGAHTTKAETNTIPATADARQAPEQDGRTENRLYTNDRIWVSNVYPNPADDVAEVDYQINGSVGEAKLILLNVLGSPIADYGLDRGDRKVRIVTRDLATGYYLYQLSVDGKKVATKRLLVRHQ